MSRAKKKSQEHSQQRPSPYSEENLTRGRGASPNPPRPPARPRHRKPGESRTTDEDEDEEERRLQFLSRVIAWYRAKNPVLMFVLVFGVLMGIYYAATLSPFFHQTLFPAYLKWNARVSNVFLNWLGQGTTVTGSSISSGRFSIDVRRGCDAIEPSVLFLSAVLAFPSPFLRKVPGILIGTLVLLVINLVRIVSLFLIGVYYPKAFHAMHADVWQIIFILLAVVFWALWIQWAMKGEAQSSKLKAQEKPQGPGSSSPPLPNVEP